LGRAAGGVHRPGHGVGRGAPRGALQDPFTGEPVEGEGELAARGAIVTRGCAFVVPAEGAAPSPEALIAHRRDGLARFNVPAHIELIAAADLPLTASGKVRGLMLARWRSFAGLH
jgi:acyl-CoA synthetase (AMP-forming)/AMP-acid ligase II